MYTGVIQQGDKGQLRLRIEEWQIDDGNRSELAKHGATGKTVAPGVAREAPLSSKQEEKPRRYARNDWTRSWREDVDHLHKGDELPARLMASDPGWPAEKQDKEWYRRNT